MGSSSGSTVDGGEGADPTGPVSFDAWVLASHRRLHRLAWLLSGDRDHAEDLTQETLWRVHRAWKRIQDPRAVHAYARTTMVRLARRRRARRWNGEVATDQQRLVGEVDPRGDVTTPVDDRLLLTAALAALPDAERDVLVLRFFEDCSEVEIASLLGCAPGTVKSRSSRALARLRVDVGPMFEGLGTSEATTVTSPEVAP